jgi:hypothetical protein
MGNFCSRRRPRHELLPNDLEFDDNVIDVDDVPWEIIENVPLAQVRNGRQPKFKKAIKKVLLLLRLRYLWSSCMSLLNTPAFRVNRNHRLRPNITAIINFLTRFLKQQHKADMFRHLKRSRNKLVYARAATERRFSGLIVRRFPLRQRAR